MSPMIASASGMMPPAPMPCSARKPASMYIDWARPQSMEPTTKMVIASMNSGLRP